MELLNLGCGYRYHPAWTNIDFIATGKNVLAHDLRQGIPYPDRSFDVVYHSHVLEHFKREQGRFFIQECYRVLKPGGIIRVVVPNLERIARDYLHTLEMALNGDEQALLRYEWALLELYDQTTRESSGGEMAPFLRRPEVLENEYLEPLLGKAVRNNLASKPGKAKPQPAPSPIHRTLFNIKKWITNKSFRREWFVRRVLAKEYEALAVGRFRHGGEIHFWMYDRYSLARLLLETGFIQPRCEEASSSQITGWSAYNLDTEPDGTSYKSDSLYMEANKP